MPQRTPTRKLADGDMLAHPLYALGKILQAIRRLPVRKAEIVLRQAEALNRACGGSAR